MAITLSAVQDFKHRAVLRVVSRVVARGKSLPFDRSYVAADTYGNRLLQPGMIVGYNDDKTLYVPWNAASSYGTYSSYAAGILDDMFDFSFEPQIVAPAVNAIAIKAHCYVYGSTLGTIPDAVVQATGNNFEMRLIQWDD